MFEKSMEECMAAAKQECGHKRILIVDVEEIVKPANETGLDNINYPQDIEELLQITTGESLSNNDPKELVKQRN